MTGAAVLQHSVTVTAQAGPEAGGGEQGTPVKDSARSCRRHAGRTGGTLFVGGVAWRKLVFDAWGD